MVLAARQDGLSFGKESTGRALTYRGQVGVANHLTGKPWKSLGWKLARMKCMVSGSLGERGTEHHSRSQSDRDFSRSVINPRGLGMKRPYNII